MPIATPDDISVRLGRTLAEDEPSRVRAFLADVAGLIEDYCGRDVERRSGQIITVYPEGGCVLPIPSRYQISLAVAGAVQGGQEVTDFVFNGRELARESGWGDSAVTLTASWGYEAVPASLKAIACSEVIRWLALSPGVGKERVGEVEVEFSAPSSAQTLSQAARTSLAPYKRSRLGSLTLRREGPSLSTRGPLCSP